MSIDSCQSVGALIGLKDQLVLTNHDRHDPALSPVRKVLISEGKVLHAATKGHIQVVIEKDCKREAHAYDVDNQLGRLISNGSCQSKLFLCYLHALTSFCIPDPLTGRTGTEEALGILNFAAVRSFDVLSQENIDMLGEIARLTPGRKYYPAHERVMQTVDWMPELSSLSQHGFFFEYRWMKFPRTYLVATYIEPPAMDEVSSNLLGRDNIRAAAFRLSEFGAERHKIQMDVEYASRDRGSTVNWSRSFSIARVVFSGQSVLAEPLPASVNNHLWSYLANGPKIDVHQGNTQFTMARIAYDAGILKESAQFVIQHWPTLHKSVIPMVCKFKLMIWLATLSYADDADMNVIQILASFRTTPNLTTLTTPTAVSGSFVPSAGAYLNFSDLEYCLWPEVKPYHRCPEVVARLNSQELFEYHQRTAVGTLATCLHKQWPCKSPTIPSDHGNFSDWKTHIELWGLPPRLEKLFEKPHDNFRFQAYLQEIAKRLPSALLPPQPASSMMTTPEWDLLRERRFIDTDTLFRHTPLMVPATDFPQLDYTALGANSKREYRLPKLLHRLRDKTQKNMSNNMTPSREEIVGYLQACRQDVQHRHRAMLEAIFITGARQSTVPSRMHNFFQMPRVTPLSILRRLDKDRFGSSPPAWEKYIASYGVALTNLQRAERMLSCWGDSVALANELRNPGHTNWDPLVYPDTLLLEIESGIMVRGVQQEIADKMRNPPLGANAVLQLNMGEGKSSVIVPMVASSSADGSCILMCIESEISGKSDVSRLLLQTKDFLEKHVRNIVDESDENFSPKFELVYTMGIQQSIEHSPDRWVCVHDVLDAIRKLLPETRAGDSTSMEISSWPRGGFPRLRILNDSACTRLFQGVAWRLSRDGTTCLPMAKHPVATREAVFTYITKPRLTEEETNVIEQSGLWMSPTMETLLLLRGLFAQGILSFVFSQKRWRVDYGPDETRNPKTRLAVPYRAMDSPAARSEFSHPEVIIILTSLSYYYEGLKDGDLFLAFRHLVGADLADIKYDAWAADSNDLPLAFRQLSGINLEDDHVCTKVLFPCLRFAKSVIDYFLANIVFSKELKEFPHKLSASGWDIGGIKSHPTTGFSGTNDSRAFLPLTVSQLDDPGQQHTNAQHCWTAGIMCKHFIHRLLRVNPMPCMRMRKLGKGQSVVFCVPNEIQQKVSSLPHVHNPTEIDVSDVLEWAISETFVDLHRGIWLWANQGRRHQRHQLLWEKAYVNGSTAFDAAHAEKFLEEEAQTLDSRYRPAQQASEELIHSSDNARVDPTTKRLLSFGGTDSDSSTFREEQERELSPEIEQEREIQRPPPVSPRQHSIHQDIRSLISDGILDPASKAWMPAFISLGTTSASSHYKVENFPQRILVTEDFTQTIIPKLPSCQEYVSDFFQRSVQWILTRALEGGVIDVAMIISPYEAQELLPELKRSKFVSLHLYAPRPNLGFTPLDTLDLYTVPRRELTWSLPRSSITELNLFSGQLYFKSAEEYVSACEFLGLAPGFGDTDTPDSTALVDGQIDLQDSNMCDAGLINFVRTLMMKIRRDCDSIDKTHVGRVLDSTSLGPDDFE
ncbi:hypothetical protein CKAH01_14643 [Colletotrichum kahawae]|uniref:ubiquitinyl hydrolase 1 n=1 Tax=Colletotrichum kahawae TaxID=34407 RepID=A0AAD9YLR2_COLKA|nr:hypothetical protein CKAH01_14643 [Colletotrichum kahawae]